MAQQLGVILTPYGANSPYGWYAEIAQARGGNGSYYGQTPNPTIDRFFYSRGEPAFYYDTQLGRLREVKPPIGLRISAWFKQTFGPKVPAPAPSVVPQLPRGDGMTPTDAEMAKDTQCYTPVASGWINANGGYVPGTWRFGWNPAGDYGPPSSLSGLGDVAPQSAVDVIGAMNAHNQRMFRLAIVSTAAVSISALFTLWTRYKRLKHDLRTKRR